MPTLVPGIDPRLQTALFAALFAVLAIATLEGLVMGWRQRGSYDWRAYASTMGDIAGRRVTDAISFSLATPVFAWAYEHRLTTVALDGVWAWVGLFFASELAYYALHRSAHRVRWFWATHSVHHSPNELTLATSLRLGWTGKLAGNAVLLAPLVWLGYEPFAVLAVLALNLLYQFWLHATWIPKLGPLEWVLNTPSHHRVHHASNPEYLDCNYGGVLIVFDRLFGSFAAERDHIPPRYGLTTPLTTYNPVRIALQGWVALGRDLLRVRSPWAAARVLLGPPPPAGAAYSATPPSPPATASTAGHGDVGWRAGDHVA